MKCLTNWLSATMAFALMANIAAAADTVAEGKIKSINADNKTFVLNDPANKDFTFKFGDNVVINRAGKETKSGLKVGDGVNVCYDKGVLNWTAHYILVREGSTKNCQLIHGNVKGYDADKKELTFTNEDKKDLTYAMGDAVVRLNMENSKIDNVKIGDHVLLIVDVVDGKSTLMSVLIDRR